VRGMACSSMLLHKMPVGKKKGTVNGERFAGLNFCGFHGFEEDRESFSVNISHEL